MEELTLFAAQSMVDQAMQLANQNFQRPICVAVTDHYGFLLTFARTDGAPVRSIQISQCKAYTAARMGVPTHEFLARVQRENILPSDFCDPLFTSLPGGSVLKNSAGRVLGGIGVSGLATVEDQSITEAIAAAFQSGKM